MMKHNFTRPKYEMVIVVLVLLAALAVSFGIGTKRDIIVKGRMMTYELSAIRNGIVTYLLVNKKLPPSLAVLASEKFSFAADEEARPYVGGIDLNGAGRPIDPFGKEYTYDPVKGFVYSDASGFRNW